MQKTGIVVDASVLAPLVILRGEQLVDDLKHSVRAQITYLTLLEVCNAYWKESLLFKRMEPGDASLLCKTLQRLQRYMDVHTPTKIGLDRIAETALREKITIYDATYLALALHLQAPLATQDRKLRIAAQKNGVRVYTLEELIHQLESRDD